ncbi:DNA-binding transcriptional repressor DeoR [Enterobacillus tribolii]|uniref:DeoR family transcriptional regulator n=1 Tax=Enterobacillus tribolii TaxID=1487935 RepID=A0A370QMB0_9GAMM|nr:DNA-binding transcriptional repressor DeoR [Enterobacillus tribolii]MBW7982288.1 DNA-binding transcriptional repressor DeoR [Enterobacillus tribolii]RDK89458.1 DeoR family transcriptional regulator [Enterobacillus tribolii]
METRRSDRINRLAQALRRTDKLHLKDAAELLRVSEMTIRRDLAAQPCDVVLLGGYVVLDPKINQSVRYFISDQQEKRVREKRHIGALASSLIAPDDVVFFDCGTTVPFIIDELDDALSFTAVCYSLNTFMALRNKPNCHVILCGGSFNPDSAIFVPNGATSELHNICPTLAFISAAGITIRQGATCYNLDEIAVKQKAISQARRSVLVADASKFGEIRPAWIAPLDHFSVLITDQAPEGELKQHLSAKGIDILS